ncbi:hypothetical protein GXW82_02275 [Streptacidiphilus sp. 4-A2]|nr:hypothetical protein [Streptacidiphilus sp. 4-A2]
MATQAEPGPLARGTGTVLARTGTGTGTGGLHRAAALRIGFGWSGRSTRPSSGCRASSTAGPSPRNWAAAARSAPR